MPTGFSAITMLAGLDRRAADLLVQMVRHGHVHRLHGRIGQQLAVIVGILPHGRESAAKPIERRRTAIGHGHDFRSGVDAQQMAPARGGTGEFASHEAADRSCRNRMVLMWPLPRSRCLLCGTSIPSINRAALSWKIASTSARRGDAQFLASLLDRAQIFVHEQRVGGLDLRRLAVLVEVKRIAGPIDVGCGRDTGGGRACRKSDCPNRRADGADRGAGARHGGRPGSERPRCRRTGRDHRQTAAAPPAHAARCNSGPGGRSPARCAGIAAGSRGLRGRCRRWPSRSAFGTCSVTQA